VTKIFRLASFLLLGLLLHSEAIADDWGAPEPMGFHSRGFSWVAEIFPPHSRQNEGGQPLCYFYEMGYPGTHWDAPARLVWKAPLRDANMPAEALVSMDGWLVTLNEWGSIGYDHALTVYNDKGALTADFSGDQILAQDGSPWVSHEEGGAYTLSAKYPISSTVRWWNKDAKYYFSHEGVLFIQLAWGPMLKINLKTGALEYGARETFPDFARVLSDNNAATEVWKTTLRFSSVTDLALCRPKTGS